MDTEILVVGGGGSGLAAAVSAAESGAKVTVLEKNPACGGTTAWSIGSITASGTVYQKRRNIVDNPDDHYEDMALFPARDGEDRADRVRPDNDALRRILVDEVPTTFQWLYDMGIEFFGPSEEKPNRRPRMHNVMPTSRSYIYHLEKRARALGVEIVTSAKAKRFLTNDERVYGVEYEKDGKLHQLVAAKAVVLASGDYAGNPDLRREWINDDVARLQPVNPSNTGDGHKMAFELGATIINKDMWSGGMRFIRPAVSPWMTRLPPYKWLMQLGNFALRVAPGAIVRQLMMSFLTTVLVPSPKLYKNGAIIVNRRGERFANELRGVPYNLANQPEAEAFIVFDGVLGKKVSAWPNYISTAPGVAYAFLNDYRRTRKDIFHEAATLDELAVQLGMDPTTLRRTVDVYNGSNEQPEGLNGLEPRGERPKLTDGPWYALGPTRNFIHYTDGGLAIDTSFRLLGENEQPIAGLYAVGNVGQGGALLRGHGHHLAWAFTSGRLVGRKVAGLPAAKA